MRIANEKEIAIYEMMIDCYEPSFTLYESEIDYDAYLETEAYNEKHKYHSQLREDLLE